MSAVTRLTAAATLALASAFTLAGCADSDQAPQKSATASAESVDNTGFFSNLGGDGVYIVTIKAQDAGTARDLKCVVAKERAGYGKYSYAYSGMDCDWTSARAPRP